jgi:hypothetical protein
MQGVPMFGGEDPVLGRPWYHEQMTLEAARAAGWSTNEGLDSAASALAWHADAVDAYNYNPLWWAAGGQRRFRAALRTQSDLIKLHFDDATSTRQIQRIWHRYLGGTLAGLLWAAELDDVAAARNVVGSGLHALQDFYSHSNWVDEPSRRRVTWPAAGPRPGAPTDPRDAMHLYTGAYESPQPGTFKHHGKYAPDCSIMRQLPADLMNIVCHAASPMSNLEVCRRWRDCQGGTSVRPGKVAGVPIPAGVVYLEPPGIALDNTWLADIGVQQRDLPDTVSGGELFDRAHELALEHSTVWLKQLDVMMAKANHQSFWTKVKTERRAAGHGPDRSQFEDSHRAPFAFLSAGSYPPNPTAEDGWYVRLQISTATDRLAGTDADIVALVDGRSFRLDHMHERTAANGMDEKRLLEHNDFEAGNHDVYVIGPLPQRPGSLALRNTSAGVVGVLEAAWDGLTKAVSSAFDDLRDLLLTIVAGHADYVGSDKATWSWTQLTDIARTGARPVTLRFRGGTEGSYDLHGTLTAVPSGDDLRVTLRLEKLHCIKESEWDRFTTDDEPFVIVAMTSPASAETTSYVSAPFTGVDTGETRTMSHTMSVTVPRYGGLIVPAQLWESDDESASDRNRMRDDFVRGYTKETVNERSRFLDAVGAVIAPSWKVDTVDAFAFRRGPVVEVARLARSVRLNRWVDPGQSVSVPLSTTPARSVVLEEGPPTGPPYLTVARDLLERVPLTIKDRMPVPGRLLDALRVALDVPALLTPLDKEQLPASSRTVTLEWKPVPNATGYRVEVEELRPRGLKTARGAAISREVTGTSLTLETRRLLQSRWRITALDSKGQRESAASPWRTFSVGR